LERSLTGYFDQQRQRVIENCKACGFCAKNCPIIEHTELRKASAKDIQKKVKAFFEHGETDEIVFQRAFSCMECFKCVDNCCPEGLNPLFVNEMIKWEYNRNNIIETSYDDPNHETSAQRVLASIQVSPEDYRKISEPSDRDRAGYVFFPGCNVYFQPEKILNALDVLSLITEDYAFVPGLDFCCGDVHLFSGSIERGDQTSKALIHILSSYHPDTVIFWCPTCHCRFVKTASILNDLPFQVISFPQFLSENMDKLDLKKDIQKRVTLHEACKSAFTGVDASGPREVLRKIPGVQLSEMVRHGKDTACCGSGAIAFFPKGLEAVRDDRLREASATNAEVLIDVCHFCHHVFVGEEPKYRFSVVNYITLLAEAIGIEREDKFKKYRQWNELDRILKDAEMYIKESPYSPERIVEAINKVIISEPES
jgi:Fe-S oxidoreductase